MEPSVSQVCLIVTQSAPLPTAIALNSEMPLAVKTQVPSGSISWDWHRRQLAAVYRCSESANT